VRPSPYRRPALEDAERLVAIRDELARTLIANGPDPGKAPRAAEGEELFSTPFPPGLLSWYECHELIWAAEHFIAQGQLAAEQGDTAAAEYFHKAGSVYLDAWFKNCLAIG
jgi:hypothetical protein